MDSQNNHQLAGRGSGQVEHDKKNYMKEIVEHKMEVTEPPQTF